MPPTCTIEGCSKPTVARGWCRAHYTRWSRYGDPEAGEPPRTAGGSEGWRTRYEVDPESGCWLWTAALDKNGYGQYDVRDDSGMRKNWRAHRFVYTQVVRPLGENEVLDHLCRVHRCVNPEHLEPVAQAINIDRGDLGAGKPRKTHCIHGHEYTPENTIIVTAGGGRNCRACAKATAAERTRRWRERRALNN